MILDYGYSTAEGIGYPAGALLYNVRQFMAKQKLPVGSMRIVLSRREVKIRSPGKSERPDGRSRRSHVHTDVGEVCAERGLHFGLHITGQGPSAGSGAEIHLKRIHSRSALDCRFRLNCTRAHRCEGKRARLKESLYNVASAVASPRVGWSNDWSRNSPKYRGRRHAGILQR